MGVALRPEDMRWFQNMYQTRGGSNWGLASLDPSHPEVVLKLPDADQGFYQFRALVYNAAAN
jgi:hypothetical protein